MTSEIKKYKWGDPLPQEWQDGEIILEFPCPEAETLRLLPFREWHPSMEEPVEWHTVEIDWPEPPIIRLIRLTDRFRNKAPVEFIRECAINRLIAADRISEDDLQLRIEEQLDWARREGALWAIGQMHRDGDLTAFSLVANRLLALEFRVSNPDFKIPRPDIEQPQEVGHGEGETGTR